MTEAERTGHAWALRHMKNGASIDYIRGALSMGPHDTEFVTGGRRAIIETLNGQHKYPVDPDESWVYRFLNPVTILIMFYGVIVASTYFFC